MLQNLKKLKKLLDVPLYTTAVRRSRTIHMCTCAFAVSNFTGGDHLPNMVNCIHHKRFSVYDTLTSLMMCIRSKVTVQWPYLRGPTASQSSETITDTVFLWLNTSLLTDHTLCIIVDRCFSNTRTICTPIFVFHCFVFNAIRNTSPFIWTLFICLSGPHHANQNVKVQRTQGVNGNWILVSCQVSPRLVQILV